MFNGKLCDINRLTLGRNGFSYIRNSKKIYVDKTDLILKIAEQDTPIFFSRPRRFGKSLLVNTLHSLFEKGLEDFHGLALEKKWHDITYSVVRLDFSIIADDTPQEFKRDLADILIRQFRVSDSISIYDDLGVRNPSIILNEIAQDLDDNSVVLLIDEYDSPLTHHLDKPQELDEVVRIINNFYATIKQYTDKFRFIFITGVTRASHVSIFSSFNNLLDLSFDDEFNSLLGFTKEDLTHYFDPYIENAANVLMIQKENIYKMLEQYYDGFQFSLDAKETVFNPWSVLSFFKLPKNSFKNYWFESGGTPSIIRKYLKINDNFDFLDYNFRNIPVEIHQLTRKYEINDIPQSILLYQAGYFSIRNEHDGYAHLVLPNIEVEESLFMLYLEENKLKPSNTLVNIMKDISNAIDCKNLKFIISVFNKILNECVSSLSNIFSDERSIRDIIYAALLQIPSLYTIKERETVKGRSDLELVTGHTCMIIEFKRVSHNQDPELALKKALEQLENKRYGLLFSQSYTLYRVAMVISTEKKMILPDFCMAL